MNCPFCNQPIHPGDRICLHCNEILPATPEAEDDVRVYEVRRRSDEAATDQENKTDEHTGKYKEEQATVKVESEMSAQEKHLTLSTAGYFGAMLVFCIPVVGLLMMFIWSFARIRNTSLKHYARARLIFAVIGTLILIVILGLLAPYLSGLFSVIAEYFKSL